MIDWIRRWALAALAALIPALVRRSRSRRSRSRSSTRSPSAGRSRRSSTGYAADFEKENPGVKLKPIYTGTLPGFDHQGADRGEERRAAGDVDPAVDRHVHADRRGRDRPVRSD